MRGEHFIFLRQVSIGDRLFLVPIKMLLLILTLLPLVSGRCAPYWGSLKCASCVTESMVGVESRVAGTPPPLNAKRPMLNHQPLSKPLSTCAPQLPLRHRRPPFSVTTVPPPLHFCAEAGAAVSTSPISLTPALRTFAALQNSTSGQRGRYPN